MENAKGQANIDDFLNTLLEQQPKKRASKPATSAITKETRRESHEATDKTPLKQKVLAVLSGKTLTAQEIAEEMYRRRWIAYPARAVIQPRITELVQAGAIEAVGIKWDAATERNVAAYKVV